jgi:putative two-component system response regulator
MIMAEDKKTVLIVDDTPDNISLLTEILKHQYRVKAALSGEKALELIKKDKPDIILLDVMMPEMDGYQVCAQLKSDALTEDIPVIFVTAKTEVTDEQKGFALGAVDYITKPVKPPLVLARVKTQLSLYDQARHLEDIVQERTKDLNHTRLEIIKRLGRAAEYKDNETGLHVIRMSWYSKIIASAMGLSTQWCELLFQAAPMHDIGKIGIPDSILLKPGKLDADEWQTMQKHPEYGANIIGMHHSPLLRLARQIAMFHHEKWDGSGYPEGLSKEDIPLAARIVAIADVFDALTTRRPYKEPWSVEDAVNYIKEQIGKHFDPKIVQYFLDSLPEILEIKERYQESSETNVFS